MASPGPDMILVCVESEGAARDRRAFLTVDDELASDWPDCAAAELGHAP